jgi:hypothetical protein
LTIFIWRYQLHAESFDLLMNSVMLRALKGAGDSQRTVVQKRSASRAAALAAVKDGTADQPVDLVGTTHPPMKKPRTESHAREASDLAANIEKAADDAANSKAAAKESSDPVIEAGKEAMVGNAPVKEVARETGTAPTQSPTAKVIDGDGKVASSAATAPFPMASIGLITLLRQLETMIQVCPSSSPRGSSWYVMVS